MLGLEPRDPGSLRESIKEGQRGFQLAQPRLSDSERHKPASHLFPTSSHFSFFSGHPPTKVLVHKPIGDDQNKCSYEF